MTLSTAVMACSVSESRDELDPDADVPAHHDGRVLDLTLEANVHAASVAGEVHGNEPTRQLGGIGVIKADPETEHGDVDHPAVTPPGGVLTAS